MATDDTLAAPATETAQDASPAPSSSQNLSPEEGIRRKMEAAMQSRSEPAQAQDKPAAAQNEMPPAENGDAVAEQAGQNDTGEQPTIEPPAGWTTEHKEWFKSLDPVRQEFLLRRDKEHQRAEARRANEHAELQRQLQSEAQQAAQERQALAQALGQYKDPLKLEFQQRFYDVLSGQIDPVSLARHDPARFAEYQAYQEKFNHIAATEQALQARAQQEEEARFSQFRKAENERLTELIPELKTKEAFEKFDVDVSNYGLSLGLPAERIRQASADELTILHKAMMWDRAKAAQAAAPKVTPPPQKPVPKVLKPSNGADQSRTDDKYAAARNKARRTGDVEDVASAIRAKMERLSSR